MKLGTCDPHNMATPYFESRCVSVPLQDPSSNQSGPKQAILAPVDYRVPDQTADL